MGEKKSGKIDNIFCTPWKQMHPSVQGMQKSKIKKARYEEEEKNVWVK